MLGKREKGKGKREKGKGKREKRNRRFAQPQAARRVKAMDGLSEKGKVKAASRKLKEFGCRVGTAHQKEKGQNDRENFPGGQL